MKFTRKMWMYFVLFSGVFISLRADDPTTTYDPPSVPTVPPINNPSLAIPSPGTHLFESEFIGTSTEVYTTNGPRNLVEGWVGQRNPLGGHFGAAPYTNIGSGIMSYRGGQGDALFVDHTLAGIPIEWMMQVRFRRDGSHISSRADFLVDLNIVGTTVQHRMFAGNGAANLLGMSGSPTISFPLTTGTWYIFEVIRFSGHMEMRIWPDSGSRPAAAQITSAVLMTSAPVNVRINGSNDLAPQASVDWIFFDHPPGTAPAGPDVVDQPSIFNSYVDCDVLGYPSGCECDEQTQDIDYSKNRSGGGTILPHSGQELFDETDMMIKGRDPVTTLKVARRHMTRVNHSDSPFGPAWAFNFTQRFRALSSGNLEVESFGRKDVFTLVSPNVWQGPTGRLERLVFDGISTATLRASGGTKIEFHTEGVFGAFRGHMTALVSSNGNRLSFEYETAATQPDLIRRKILRIVDSFGRTIQFFYEDPQYPAGLSRILCFDNREWIYDYNTDGQLLSVRSPLVLSTGGLNDFPAGKLRRYSYLNHSDPLLKNALTSFIAPNQSATLEPRMGWTYETLATSPFFGFVRSHTIGNPSAPGILAAGGTYTYDYVNLTPSGTVTAGDPVIRTIATDRRNTRTELTFNRTGQLLREDVFTHGLRATGPAKFTRQFHFNAEGDLTKSIDAEGRVSLRTQASNPAQPRFAAANETQRVEVADDRGGDQATITFQRIYEPIFNMHFKEVDPRGFEPGHNPADYTTVTYLDYMEDLPAAIAHFAADPTIGLTAAQLTALFTAAGITDLGADVNGDGVRNQFKGNKIKVQHPMVTLPPQAALAGLGPTQESIELWRYNEFGQETFYQDEESNVTLTEYFSAADPDGDGVIDVMGASSTTGGFFRKATRDALSIVGRNSGQNPAPVQATLEVQYTAQGTFPANRRGVPTAVIDARGVKSTFLINELEQKVKVKKAVDVSAATEPGLIAFGYEEITLYNANDVPVERRIQNKDGLDGANDFIVHKYSFDILDQLREELLDDGFLAIRNSLAYDPSENLIEKARGVGTPEASAERWTHDERDIEIAHILGAGAAEESTFTNEINLNGAVTAMIDAQDSHRAEFVRDGFDRVKTERDRHGHEHRHFFDSASNEVSEEEWGSSDETESDFIMLSKTETRFDERNRPFRTDAHIFHYPGRSVGVIDDGALDPGDGLVSTVVILDRKGRTVGAVDSDGDLDQTRFDGLDRSIRSIDPSGNEVVRLYDKNSNSTETQEIEKADGLIADPEIFITRRKFDALNRSFELKEPNGQTTRLFYDSRNNAFRTKDALGNEKEFLFDRLSRGLGSRTYLSANGLNASATNKDSNQGGGDGIITIGSAYDALHRMVSQTDDKGQATRHSFDALDRKVRTDYQDGTLETWAYNRDSELIGHVNQNGSVETYTNDPNGQPISLDVDNAPAIANGHNVLGTTRKEWGYDGMDRTVFAFDDNGSGEDVTCRHIFNSLSQPLREGQAIGSRAELFVDGQWQGSSRRVGLAYPHTSAGSSRELDLGYDENDRLEDISESSGTDIASFAYVGAWRDLQIIYGNGAELDMRNNDLTQSSSGRGAGYDANRRVVRWEWDNGRSCSSHHGNCRGSRGHGRGHNHHGRGHGYGHGRHHSFSCRPNSNRNVIASYESVYNGPYDNTTKSNIGTNRRVSEWRGHLNQGDEYRFDSSYRMLAFARDLSRGQMGRHFSLRGRNWHEDDCDDWHGNGRDSRLSVRVLDGADSMLRFKDEGRNKNPIIDDFPNPDDNGVNQYSEFGGKAQVYDDDGSLIDNGDQKLAFDFQNRLVEVRRKSNNALIATYFYTADGRRVMKTLGSGAVTRFLRLGWQIIEERNGADAILRQYVKSRSLDEVIQMKDYTKPSQPIYFFHGSSQGFVGALTDSRGSVVEYYTYSMFGRRTILDSNGRRELSASKVGNPIGFHGKWHDAETGLIYFEFRYYSPITGQFMSTDPLGWDGGLHGNIREAFGGDGWNNSDPEGLGPPLGGRPDPLHRGDGEAGGPAGGGGGGGRGGSSFGRTFGFGGIRDWFGDMWGRIFGRTPARPVQSSCPAGRGVSSAKNIGPEAPINRSMPEYQSKLNRLYKEGDAGNLTRDELQRALAANRRALEAQERLAKKWRSEGKVKQVEILENQPIHGSPAERIKKIEDALKRMD